MKTKWKCLDQLKGKLIVSCQASIGEPLCAPEHIKALALSALNGGAGGLRLEGTANISYVRQATDVPIVGLIKSLDIKDEERLHKVYITSTFAEAKAIAESGADIIAVDATFRPREQPLSLSEFIAKIHSELNKPVWADIATLDEGVQAAKAGADIISTTMAGYTAETYVSPETGPDLALLGGLCLKVITPVVLEGRVWHPEEVSQALKLGAFAVVVGSAITRPQLITQRFVQACI